MNKYEGHTPGPWRVGDAGATVFGPPNGKPSPTIIASVSRSMATKRKHADARLIADAPMLLAQRDALAAALDECLPIVETEAETRDDWGRKHEDREAIEEAGNLDYLVSRIRAALAALTEVKAS